MLIAISAVAVAVVVIGASLYVLHQRQPQITVKEGSASFTFIGDFFSSNSVNPLFTNSYNATTLISEKGSSDFSLHASMQGSLYGFGQKKHIFAFFLNFHFNGSLPYNLHPTGLQFSVEPIKGSTPAFKSYITSFLEQSDVGGGAPTPMPDNVSLSTTGPGESFGLNLNLTLLNDSNLKSNQNFNFSVWDHINSDAVAGSSDVLQYNTTYGISVTASLTGLSEPVSDTFYLFFIDIPKG